jgi:hypothetical protein
MVAAGMSEENVAIVRELLDAFARRDHARESATSITDSCGIETRRSGSPDSNPARNNLTLCAREQILCI